jgi:hypothetical protein
MTTRSILDELLAAAAAGQPARFALKPTIKVGRAEALLVGVDNGNDAIKAATFAPDGTLHTIRIPAAVRAAQRLLAAEQEVSYQIDNQTLWVGETALAHDGDALPVGPTRQRLIDPRQRQLLAATLVALLRQAGYAPGEHSLVLGFAVPNTEIIVARDAAGQEKRTVDDATRGVLEATLKNAAWPVVRVAEDGSEEVWTLHLVTALPQAQTAGTILAVTKNASGKTVSDYDGLVVLDLGGGDIHETEVSLQPRFSMLTQRIGDGSIRIARALKAAFPRLPLNDAQAQQALITRQLLISGRNRDIGGEVEQVLDSQGQAVIADILPSLRQARRYVIITGGLTILLHRRLVERLALEQKRTPDDYLVINGDLAPLLNAVGVLFGAAFVGAGRKG